ncbi:MAG: apolipoprotein N-acyltransferase [Sandaracinaceae bacterium]
MPAAHRIRRPAQAMMGGGRIIGSFRAARGEHYNSAIAIDRDGRIVGVADKVELLAFGEYTPLWEEIELLQRFPRGMTRGHGIQSVTVAGARIGVLNCYEDLLYEHVRWQAHADPDFWANLTNNTWFGDTNAPYLHHQNARMRAIETRRDLVRAVNSGVSGLVAATGEDEVTTGTFERATFLATVRRLSGRTVYVTIGDLVTPLCAAWMLAFAWVRRRERYVR